MSGAVAGRMWTRELREAALEKHLQMLKKQLKRF